jgi:hypothetical protein
MAHDTEPKRIARHVIGQYTISTVVLPLCMTSVLDLPPGTCETLATRHGVEVTTRRATNRAKALMTHFGLVGYASALRDRKE